MKGALIPKMSPPKVPKNLLKAWPLLRACLLIFFITQLLSAVPALAQGGGGFDLSWFTVDGGGITFATSESYLLGGTIGQPDAGQMASETYILRGGFWKEDLVEPTSVTLLSFTATGTSNSVILHWETASEIDNLGFNLYRADAVDGTRVKINPTLIPSASPGDVMGAWYEYIDTDVLIGNTYFYWLENLDTSMRVKTVAGPVEASVWHRFYMPLLSAGN